MPVYLQADAGTAAVALPNQGRTELPELVDFAGGNAALQRRQVDGWSDLTGEDRDRIFAKLEWMRAVWAVLQDQLARGHGSLAAAIDQVRLDHPEIGRELADAGKNGADARRPKNWRHWADALGRNPSGEPRWDKWHALAPKYGRQVRSVSADTEAFFRDVCKLWLRPEAPSLVACIRDAAAVWRGAGHAQHDLPTLRQISYLVKQRVPPSVQERYRGGGRLYNARSRGYVARCCNVPPGDAWFSDHRISDFFVRMPHPDNPEEWIARRPWCTAFADAATGCILSARLYLSAPNHERIIETLQGAILASDMTPPRIVYTDQGKDYLATGLCAEASLRTHDGQPICGRDGAPYAYSILRALHVEHKMAAPYNGKEKTVERHFGAIAGDFDRTMPGYCGRAPQYRPDPQETYGGDVRALCTLEEATARLDHWIRTVHHQVRLPDGRTRAEAWQARPARPEAVLDERRLFFGLLRPEAEARIVRRTSVGRCGIHLDGWMYSHADLREWQDKPVLVKTYWGIPRVDRKDRQVPAGVFIFRPDDAFICAAPADPVADMFAETDDARAALGHIQHLINAVAKLDRVDYQHSTGLQRLPPSRDRALALVGAEADAIEPGPAIAQISSGHGHHRRLPAAAAPAPADTPPPGPRASRADVALLERLLAGDTIPAEPAPTAPPAIPFPSAQPGDPDQVRSDFDLLAEITQLGG